MSESIARRWHDLLLSTEPVDRPRAESAVRAAYRAAGLAEPQRMLWCASPLEAIWAALVLIGEGEGYNVPLLQDVRRRKGGEERLASAPMPSFAATAAQVVPEEPPPVPPAAIYALTLCPPPGQNRSG